MRNNKFIDDIFNLIEVVIDFNNKLYKKIIKKQYNSFYKRTRIFFKLTVKYY